jgi:putative ABC transport system substrate-binding protein
MKALLVALLLACPVAAQAQPAAKILRIGVVFTSVPLQDLSGTRPRSEVAAAIVKGLEDYGWIAGRNVEILWRSAEQRLDRREGLIEELVRLPVDVLVVYSEGTARIALQKTRKIPIVMATSSHPVEAGVVASLARPGGNVTGLSHAVDHEVDAKRLALLKQAAPGVSRVAFLRPQWAMPEVLPPAMVATARSLGVTLFFANFDTGQLERAIDDAAAQGANALYVPNQSELNNADNRKVIQRAAIRHRIPAMYCTASDEDLMSYSAPRETSSRVAYFVDRILRGANPGEIPIERPTTFHLVVNLDSAKKIGLTIPQSVLMQADRVIR